MVWEVENVHCEPGANFCSQGGDALDLSGRFRAQLVAFHTRLFPTGFLTVLELERSSVMALPGSYPAAAPRAMAIF